MYLYTSYSPHLLATVWAEDELVRLTACGLRCTNTMLTKWSLLTRLETRTKESNIYASRWVANPAAQ